MDRPVPETTPKSKVLVTTEELAAGDHSEAIPASLPDEGARSVTASAAVPDEGPDLADLVELGACSIHSAHAMSGAAFGLEMGLEDHSEAISSRLQGVGASPATKGAAVVDEGPDLADLVELGVTTMHGAHAMLGAAFGREMEAAHEHEVTRGAAAVGFAHFRVSDALASDECASSHPFAVEDLLASLQATTSISTSSKVVDPHNPPPIPSFRELEPTRLTCNAEAHRVRDHTVVALDELGCVIHDDQRWHLVAEVYVKYAATRFAVHVFRAVDGRVIVEWAKIEGCTLAFCDTYRAFAQNCIDQEEKLSAHDASGFAAATKSYAEQQDLPPLVLPQDDSEREETLAPVMAMLKSEWSTSQREACCMVATLADSEQNTKQLIASRMLPLLAMHLQSRDRHTVRCAAAAIANLARGASAMEPPAGIVSQFESTRPSLERAASNAQCAQTRYECDRALRGVLALR